MHTMAVEGGDMQSFLDMYEKSRVENSFFYRVKVDEDNHISCLFWGDLIMLDDFKVFGDFLITDTTHRTNKYNLICAPFVGINNYWRIVMFGYPLITNEKNDTYMWLFDTFKINARNRTEDYIHRSRSCLVICYWDGIIVFFFFFVQVFLFNSEY